MSEDMSHFRDIDQTQKRLPHVYGYLAHPLLPLREAIEPFLPQIEHLNRFCQTAINECYFPSEHGLTQDESAAIFLFAMELGDESLYRVINRALRTEDRTTIIPCFAYLKLYDTAARKLPTVRTNLWRVANEYMPENFKENDELTWWSISSCTTSLTVIKSFLGPRSTLFLIEAVNGKDVKGYTNYPDENEVILLPGTRLRVVGRLLYQSQIHIVHLKEIIDNRDSPLSASVHTESR